MRIAVFGAGAWGTALAIAFSRNHAITLWSREASEIEALHQGGVRSIRLNLEVKGEQGPETARRLLQQALQVAAHRQWSVQMYADLGLVESLEETLAGSRLPVVLDHFAGLKAARGLAQPGWSALLRLCRRSGRAALRCQTRPPPKLRM
jgi:predicted TIM-barrel fold metal-dependent hydrolase